MKITTKQPEIERTLNRRLKIMGFIMFSFAVIAIVWDLIPFIENEFDELIFELEEAPPPLNRYLISSSFAVVGGFCFFVYWKTKNLLSSQKPPES